MPRRSHDVLFGPNFDFHSVDNTFNLLGEDSIVLSKLLHALSVFTECMGSAAPPSALYRMVTLPSYVNRIVPR